VPKPKGNEVKINYRSVKVAILEVKQLTKIYGTKKMAQEVLRDINNTPIIYLNFISFRLWHLYLQFNI
jgi:hypothetical protein